MTTTNLTVEESNVISDAIHRSLAAFEWLSKEPTTSTQQEIFIEAGLKASYAALELLDRL